MSLQLNFHSLHLHISLISRGAWYTGNAEGKGGVKVLTRDWHFLVPITLRVIMPHVPT